MQRCARDAGTVRAGPAECADPTRPEQLRELGRVGHQRQVQPEPATDPERRPRERMVLLLVGEPIGGRGTRRLQRQDPDAVGRLIVQQHLDEPQVVVGGGLQSPQALQNAGGVGFGGHMTPCVSWSFPFLGETIAPAARAEDNTCWYPRWTEAPA